MVILSNSLHIFFDYYSANTPNINVNHLENKRNLTKSHYFYLHRTYNSQHIILTSSQKNCTGTGVD